MRKKFLAQEATPTPGPIPPIEDIFACLTPRITGKEPLPRVSCMIGGEETTAQTPFQIECIAPRLACMMGLRETAGSFRLGGIMKKAKELPKIKGLGNKPGIGIPLGNSTAQQQQRIIQRQKQLQRQQPSQQGPHSAGEKVIVRP